MQASRLWSREHWSFRKMRCKELCWWKAAGLAAPLTLLLFAAGSLAWQPRLAAAVAGLLSFLVALFLWEDAERGRALADAFLSGPVDAAVDSAWVSAQPYRLGDLVFYNSPRWHAARFPASLAAAFEQATSAQPPSGDVQARLDLLSEQLDAPLLPDVLAVHLRVGDACQMPLRAALTGRGVPLHKRVWGLVPHGQPQPNAGPASLREILELVAPYHYSLRVVVVAGAHVAARAADASREYVASVLAMLSHRFAAVELRTAQSPDDDLIFCVSAEHCAVGVGRFASLIGEMRRRRNRATASVGA